MGLLFSMGCKKPYEPFAINANNRFLVIEGVINTAPGGVTNISLSRTRNLNDTVLTSPENNGSIRIEARSGAFFTLTRQGEGAWTSGTLNLNAAEEYRLKVVTSDGEYVSSFQKSGTTPAIDSLSWEQPDDLSVYLYTHDPARSTTYYRWEYNETWEYRSFYDSHIGFRGDSLYFLDPSEVRHRCWSSAGYTEVLIASTANLSEDVVSRFPIINIIRPSIKVSVRYSILVRQYGLTKEAFDYWQILKNNKIQRGSLFDGQPAQLVGNIQSVNNPSEPVIGYISVCPVREKRLFIRNGDVRDWPIPNPVITCEVTIVDRNDVGSYLSNPDLGAAYFVTVPPGVAISKKQCIDCTMAGGVNVQPSFW